MLSSMCFTAIAGNGSIRPSSSPGYEAWGLSDSPANPFHPNRRSIRYHRCVEFDRLRDVAMQTFSATCPLLLLICALVGCKSPMRAITSSTLFIPKPVMAHVTTEMEKPPKTEPIRSTIVQGQQAPGVPRVALIDVDGLLVNSAVFRSLQAVDNPVGLFREKLHVASQDPDVCAFVIRINSPGGGVVASDLMFHELEQLKAKTGRPVVAYIMETGTGGAYLLATAADMIVTHPNAIVGGVGVVFNRYYLSDIMGQQGAYHEPIVSGENITMGSYTEEISEENQAWFETMAEEFHSRLSNPSIVAVRRWIPTSRRP